MRHRPPPHQKNHSTCYSTVVRKSASFVLPSLKITCLIHCEIWSGYRSKDYNWWNHLFTIHKNFHVCSHFLIQLKLAKMPMLYIYLFHHHLPHTYPTTMVVTTGKAVGAWSSPLPSSTKCTLYFHALYVLSHPGT